MRLYARDKQKQRGKEQQANKQFNDKNCYPVEYLPNQRSNDLIQRPRYNY